MYNAWLRPRTDAASQSASVDPETLLPAGRMHVHAFVDILKQHGVRHGAGVPCSYFTPLVNATSGRTSTSPAKD